VKGPERHLASIFRLALAAAALACQLAAAEAPPPAANAAGAVVLVDGKATLTRGGTARPVRVGDAVNEGDEIASAADGEVHLRMQDSGFVVLRPGTRMKVASYKADGGDDDHGVLQLIAGGIRSVSGWIGKFNAKGYSVKTATATIGIRGTDHETRYVAEGSAEGEPGTYDRVYAGRTFIQTAAGQTEVAPGEAGFQPRGGTGRARILASIPRFYKPGPHEGEIDRKHAEIQKEIDERREERRRAIAQMRAALQTERGKVKSIAGENQAAAKAAREAQRVEREANAAKREKLKADIQAAAAMRQEIQESRRSLEEDYKSGRISQQEARPRRRELVAKQKAFAELQESIKQRRQEMGETGDAAVDERFEAAQARQKALHDQVLEAREKRKALEAEREAAAKEMKARQQEENKRYREELRKDREGAAPATDPPKP